MAEYIERASVMLHIAEQLHQWGDDYDVEQVLGDVEDFPAADVVEVRHGYWYITEYELVNCSECGDMYYTGMESTAQAQQNLLDGEVPNYCPNCGAKMDGKGEDE